MINADGVTRRYKLPAAIPNPTFNFLKVTCRASAFRSPKMQRMEAATGAKVLSNSWLQLIDFSASNSRFLSLPLPFVNPRHSNNTIAVIGRGEKKNSRGSRSDCPFLSFYWRLERPVLQLQFPSFFLRTQCSSPFLFCRSSVRSCQDAVIGCSHGRSSRAHQHRRSSSITSIRRPCSSRPRPAPCRALIAPDQHLSVDARGCIEGDQAQVNKKLHQETGQQKDGTTQGQEAG